MKQIADMFPSSKVTKQLTVGRDEKCSHNP